MPVIGLGHTGLWVTDLARMRDFYERVIAPDRHRHPERERVHPAREVNA